jgi:hypothetical protein
MASYPELCIQACRRQGIVLDTNVFILLLIGCWNLQMLVSEGIKRIESKSYSTKDFRLLMALLSPFPKKVVTQGIVTETCNLLDSDNQKFQGSIFRSLSQLLNSFSESQKSSKVLSTQSPFPQFGLADTSVADLANRGYLIVTDDLKLQNFLQSSGRFSLNFSQIRAAN